MNSRIKLTYLLLVLGVIIGMVPENTTKPYKLSAIDMVDEVISQSELIAPDELADWLINQVPTIQLIDVRDPDMFESFHLQNAINIPMNSILDPEWVDVLDQGVNMNILYSNGTTNAYKCWMILRQLGYENNYVLQGGLNYWAETILNPSAPPSTSPDDEIAKYSFRKGAGQFFGGSISNPKPTDTPKSDKPKIIRRKKKKAPDGGC